MEKKNYEIPDISVVELAIVDCIHTSEPDNAGKDPIGDPANPEGPGL